MQDAQGIQEAPPVGEQIHVPAPSLLPILNAAGISIAIVGITISMVLVIAGAVLFLATTVVWARAAARELDELPGEHHGAH
jgi:hypothetical protein